MYIYILDMNEKSKSTLTSDPSGNCPCLMGVKEKKCLHFYVFITGIDDQKVCSSGTGLHLTHPSRSSNNADGTHPTP